MKLLSAHRRRFLRGLGGVCLALPNLPSLLPRAARAQGAKAPKRFAVIWQNNGINTKKFWPSTTYGALTASSFAGGRAIEPLAPYRDKLLIPRGLNMVGNGGHLGVHGLTGTAALPHSGLEEMRVAWAQGISVDRAVAKTLNQGGREPLTLRSSHSNQASGSVYYSASYRKANEVVFGERNPWIAYRDLMGLAGDGGQVATNLLVKRRRSVLDLVEGRLELLNRRQLSAADRRKLEIHFASVRDLEQRLQASNLACALSPTQVSGMQALTPATLNDRARFGQVGRMHLDIIAFAFACDLNRVATMFYGMEAGGPTYDFDGLKHVYPHHPLSHGTRGEATDSGDVPDYLERLYEIDHWHAQQMRYFLDRLASYDDGEGSLLDQSCVVWMNSMTDGNQHSSRDMPVVIAGSGGGFLRTGQYVNVAEDGRNIPHNMLLTTLANSMGLPETHFGAPDLGRSGQITSLQA